MIKRTVFCTLYFVLCRPHTWKQHKNDTFIVYLLHKVKFPGFLVHVCYMAPMYSTLQRLPLPNWFTPLCTARLPWLQR